MLFLAAHHNRPIANDPIALALLLVVIVCFGAFVLHGNRGAKKLVQQESVAPAPVPEASLAPGVAGQLKLHDVKPKTAAMLMAIVAEKPVNLLTNCGSFPSRRLRNHEI